MFLVSCEMIKKGRKKSDYAFLCGIYVFGMLSMVEVTLNLKFIILLAFVGLAWEKEKVQDNNGSATNLYDCMRKAVSFDIPLADAIFAATRNPAQSIGIYDEVGSIAPGKKAHVLLVDDELNLKQVIM